MAKRSWSVSTHTKQLSVRFTGRSTTEMAGAARRHDDAPRGRMNLRHLHADRVAIPLPGRPAAEIHTRPTLLSDPLRRSGPLRAWVGDRSHALEEGKGVGVAQVGVEDRQQNLFLLDE